MSEPKAGFLLAVALAPFALLACGARPTAAPSAAPQDAGPGDASTAPPPDAGAPQATTAPRKMISVPFLEGVSIEERVMDPGIELTEWFFLDAATGATTIQVNRVALARAPAGQPAIFVPAGGANANGVSLGTLYKMPDGPSTASIWVGAKDDANASISLAVVTLDESGTGTPNYYALAPDPSSKVAIGGLRWTRYEGTVPKETVPGWGYVYAGIDGTRDVYVQGASVVETSARRTHRAPVVHAAPIPAAAVRWVAHARSVRPPPPLPGIR